jgi:hypothetical protein
MRRMMAGFVVDATTLLLPLTAQPPTARAVNLPDRYAAAALTNQSPWPSGLLCPLWCPENPNDMVASLLAPERSDITIARNATRKFRVLAHARRHGYKVLRDKNGIACIAMPGMGAMGVHFANGDLVGTPGVHLRRPEALVYDHENGHRRLVALEYVVLRKAWRSVHRQGAPPPRLFGQRFNLTRAGNRFGLPAFYSLHAWIWRHNPEGTFAMWNPKVHCHTG